MLPPPLYAAAPHLFPGPRSQLCLFSPAVSPPCPVARSHSRLRAWPPAPAAGAAAHPQSRGLVPPTPSALSVVRPHGLATQPADLPAAALTRVTRARLDSLTLPAALYLWSLPDPPQRLGSPPGPGTPPSPIKVPNLLRPPPRPLRRLSRCTVVSLIRIPQLPQQTNLSRGGRGA